MPTALVPVRPGRLAKARLAHVLDAAARSALVAALFEHVAGVLDAAGVEVVAVAPGPRRPNGPEVWTEEAPGLNPALARALDRMGGDVLVLPADLPDLDRTAVERLLAEPGDVVVVRARDGGTNGLLLRRRIPPAFGPGSALAHAASARRLGLRARVVSIDGFCDDLDDEAGLVRALDRSPALPPGTARRLGLPTLDERTPEPEGPGAVAIARVV